MTKKSHHNKSAFITGAAHRIGAEIALTLAKQGYDIALHYFHSKKEAQKLLQAIQKIGRSCKLYQADLRHAASVKKLIPRIHTDFPGLEILVNNASIFEAEDFMQSNSKSFDDNFNLHLKSPFFLTQAFSRQCKTGQIINLVDSKICHNQSLHFTYLLSKKALLEFTKMSALSLAPRFRVNAIAPGVILAPAGSPKNYLEKLIEKVPLKKSGSLKDISQALIFLIENEYITGQCLYLDGGSHLL